MDETAIPAVVKIKDDKNNNSKVQKVPERLESAPPKTYKKFPIKSESANRKGPLNKPNQQKTVDSKISASTASKSSSSINPNNKSKIPAMKKSTLDTTKTSAKQNSIRNNTQENPVKNPRGLKQKPTPRSNVKAGVAVSESAEVKIARSRFVNFNAAARPDKSTAKFQTERLRSNSEMPTLYGKQRCASNVSTRSTPCVIEKEITSAAGDCIETKEIQKDAKQEQNELLTDILQAAFEANGDDLKCKMESKIDLTDTDEMQSPEIDLADTDKIEPCNVELHDELQSSRSNNVLIRDDNFCEKNNVNELKMKLEEANRSFKTLEAQYTDLLQKHEAESIKLEKDLREKAAADIAKKDEDIKEFQSKSRVQDKKINNFRISVQNLEKEKESIQIERDNLRTELKSCTDSLSAANKKLQDTEQQLKQEKRDVKSKTEIIKKMEHEMQKLNKELAEMTTQLEVLQTEMTKKAQMESGELLKQISELSSQIKCLETANAAFKKQKEKLEQEVHELPTIKEKLAESENKWQELQKESDRKISELASVPKYSKEVEMEFAKLRQTEADKQREIDKLKTELSKAQFNICQLEEHVQRDQQLLDVRSGLINSLQKNEKAHRIHIEDMFAQVAEKNNTINEINCELQLKSEEFRNLFTSLSAKQVEMANQERIVKLLEESNERSHLLRVKQEEKIGRLEQELANLKQSIAFYQAKVLAANSDKQLLPAPPTNVNYNENFYYYVSQRKRKRHIDINVKTYEA